MRKFIAYLTKFYEISPMDTFDTKKRVPDNSSGCSKNNNSQLYIKKNS